jgi:hypothetical protein
MTDSNIDNIFSLFDNAPSLVLFESISDQESKRQKEVVSNVCKISQKVLNPIDVVMESLVNIFSEEISSKEITLSKDSVLVNNKVRNLAIAKVLKIVGNDSKMLQVIHDKWLDKLRSFVATLCSEAKQISIDMIIFQVSSQFRISSLSAVKAIKSI